jgi:glycosyltransferase involved in cell wall biosynthesis
MRNMVSDINEQNLPRESFQNENGILVVGAIPNSAPESKGGATVLLQSLLHYFDVNKISYRLVVTNFPRKHFGALKNIIVTLTNIYRLKNCYEYIMVNCSQNGAVYLAPLIYLITRGSRARLIFRAFGGGLRETLKARNWFVCWLFRRTVLKYDFIFVETKQLLEFFVSEYGRHVNWFPNARSLGVSSNRNFQRRYVFISHVKRTKGVLRILEASAILGPSYVIDVYGPIVDDSINNNDFKNSLVNYKGMIDERNVKSVMAEYDVLLLPTFYEGEGYPGVILEAYSIGMPCITTKWKAIGEIVDDGVSGILIKPDDATELVSAIASIDAEKYKLLCRGARAKFSEFDQDVVNSKFMAVLGIGQKQ